LRACFEEAIENIKDVIMLCLEDFNGKTLPVQPEIIGIKRLELAV
jgi:predicted RNase H-like HicB family nuclease